MTDASEFDFDLFVIGAGSGGVAAARRAAEHGARVAICEDSRVGGTCVNRGCVPKKLYVYASHFHESFEHAGGFGWRNVGATFDWRALVDAKDRELERLNGIYSKLLADSGVTYLVGRGTLADANTVVVGDARHRAHTILVATGARAVKPDHPGVEHTITSDEAFDLPALPKRIAVIGGGYIAVEFAGIWNGLGVDTTLVHRRHTVLRGFDEDVRAVLTEEIAKKGIRLRMGATIDRFEKRDDGTLVTHFVDGEPIESDTIMCATGRLPNSAGLDLEAVGVQLDAKGAVRVDEWSRTAVPNIYAVGDVTDRINLTPVAIHEGRSLAETLYNANPRKPDHEDVPSAVFSQPPVGSVGLSEAAAIAKYGSVDVYRSTFRPLKHTLSGSDEKTMMKLVVDRHSGRVVGCHMVGEDAGEIVQGVAIAIKCGATKAQFDATIGIHPTSAEELVTMRFPVTD